MTERKANTMEIRKINRNMIYRYLHRGETLSKQEIAYALGMSLPTVSQNLKDLMAEGLVCENGRFDSTGGRKAQALCYNPDARFSIGLDVTRNHLGIVILNIGGEVVNHRRFRTPFSHTESYYQMVWNLMDGFLDEFSIDREKILGVGIAVPAIVSSDGQYLTYSPVLGPDNIRLEDFSRHIPFPCSFCNDANAGGFAEAWHFDHKENSIYLSLNNTVGGSILLNNTICHGENQRSGEFGHMTLVPEGKLCYCGKRGCVDPYCSASLLSNSTDGSLERFFQLLQEGNPMQQKIWEEYLYYLVLTINNLRMIFDYDVIVGGYVGAYLHDYTELLRERVARHNTFEQDGSYLHICQYRLEATAVGAALQYIEEFLRSV